MLRVPAAHTPGLLFFYDAERGLSADRAGRYALTPQSSAAIGHTKIGPVALHTGSSMSLVSPAFGTFGSLPFSYDLTLVWHGIVFGNRIGDYPTFLGVSYGDATGVPYVLAHLNRINSNDTVRSAANDGTYQYVDHAVSLSSLYNIPLVIAFSNAAASATHNLVITSPGRAPIISTSNAASASGNPKTSTYTDKIYIGGEISDTSVTTNSGTRSALIWQRAMPVAEMLAVADALMVPHARSRPSARTILVTDVAAPGVVANPMRGGGGAALPLTGYL